MPPMQAAVEGTQRDRPRGAGDDAVARRDLRAGRLHERHGRPLHAELRPDDGVRRDGVAARQLHADADDVRAVAEGEAARQKTSDITSTTRSTRRSSDRSIAIYTRMLEWSMAHRGIVAALAVARAASRACRSSASSTSTSRRRTISRSSTSACARRKARASRRPRSSPTAWRRRFGGFPEVDYTMVTVAGDSAGTLNTASIYVRLQPIDERERDQFAVMDEVRNDDPAEGRAGRRADSAAGARHRRRWWRRRRAGTGRRPVRDAGPEPRRARAREQRAGRPARRRIPGLVDVDTSLRVGKPEMSVRLDRPKAADLGVQVSDAAEALRLLVGGDQVTTYNEGGRAVRGAPARRGAEPRLGGGDRPAARCPRRGSAACRSTTSRRFAHGDAPADIRRLNRQRQVTVGANMLPGTSQAAAQQQIARGRGTARTRARVPHRLRRPLARAQSHRQRVPSGARAVADLHVSRARGAVRVVAAPGDDSAVAAADAAVRARCRSSSSGSR